MKKVLLIAALLSVLGVPHGMKGQSFSYAYQGKILNYTVSYGNAEVTGYTGSLDGTVVIPDSVEYESVKYAVKSIGLGAFSYNSEMDTLVIPNTVLSIGNNAFRYCRGLASVTIGNLVASIGNTAFEQDTMLASLTIPASVATIGDNAFLGCKGLTSITVAAGNTVFDSRNSCNAIIQTNTNELVLGCPSTVIPATVTSIASNAFSGYAGLTSITIPESVISLGNKAFNGTGLTSVTLPVSLTQIGVDCFLDCTNLVSVTLGDSLVSIGASAFCGCTALTSIVLPDKVVTLGAGAFYGCTALTSVTLSNSLYYIDINTFRNCSSLLSIVIPNSASSVGSNAFNGCTSLASVTLPNNPNYPYFAINYAAFKGCTSLTSVVFSNSVSYIGQEAFQHCTGLTSISFGSSLSSIVDQAFGYCTALAEIHSRRATPPELGTNVFLGVPTTIPVYVPCTTSDYQSASGWNTFTNYVNVPFVVTVESAGNGTVAVVQPTCEHDTATITATPAEGFTFYRWSDGNNENPRIFHPTSDLSLMATFGPDTCVVTSLPYTIDFEDNNLLDCWTYVDQDGDGRNWQVKWSLTNQHSGLSYLCSESYNNDVGILTPDNWFISPAIELPEGSLPQLRWFAKGQDANYFAEHYTVYVSTTGNSPTDFTTVLYTGNTTHEWVEQVADLTDYVGQTVYVAFRHHNSSNMFQLNIDDISVIDLYSYISDSCFVGTFPYTMGFENTDNLACWNIYDNNNDNLSWARSSGVPHTGTYSATSVSYSGGVAVTPDNWLVSCPFELPADTAMMLSWFAKGGDPTYFSEHYSVYVSTTGNTPAAFSTVLYAGNTTNAWEQHFVDLSAYAGQLVWVAFRHHDCSDMNYLNIDDITISQATPQYTITVSSGNAAMGTVTGGGVYHEGTTATLTATANSGYHFVSWNDSNTENPRTVTVMGNASYIAYFAEDVFVECDTINTFPWVNTFDSELTCWRTVDADGDGYNWGYNNGFAYSESYSYFDSTYQSLSPDNWLISRPIHLPSNGDATLAWAAQALNTAYYNEHYSVYVSTTGNNPSDFSTQLFSETLSNANVANRTVSLQNYRGQTVRIAFRHHNTSDVFVLGLGSIGITFVEDPPVQYTLTVTSADPTMGTVTGSGTYDEGTTVTLTATANSGYHFTHWQDNITENPRTVTVSANATYTAYFEADPPVQYTLTVTSADPAMGTVTGSGTYDEGTTATLTATANNGYHFSHWQDNNTDNPRIVTVTSDVTYTAYFEADSPVQYTLTVTSSDPAMGTVTGSGTYDEGATATLTATANSGYRFSHWQDNNTDNPRIVTVSADATYIAYFESTQGIEDVSADEIHIFMADGRIVVESELEEEIAIYDIVGHKVDSGHKVRFDVPSSGTYLIKVGNQPARKIVVVR